MTHVADSLEDSWTSLHSFLMNSAGEYSPIYYVLSLALLMVSVIMAKSALKKSMPKAEQEVVQKGWCERVSKEEYENQAREYTNQQKRALFESREYQDMVA